ncbi:MAG: LysR family transcriptional regulator [Mesorhizobium sp.]|uniref:LysR family transcriptional regulator n=1 Tax=unclassified Mesorhizobium TaxID=325217 RepID=UPI000FD39B71|nr:MULTISPECIES: LysR family transcriptional regulator [unclassified Mesorhizobium]RUX06196.1 LysR family transcriptional regulator [Mesorhizobium sp. M8A.F.Ca.ET.023.01.1.1]RWC68439.1 MAG: LysR family transcriptional regulator [Mesorhizobium sp.]RWF46156.1 MAG: LysR family transcriptional regulator [Mesorhizobium sp.]TGQ81015.1 LysR family transcriptional regulator [Mesorhizobium sp. M8A.F.Ca.ET.207.01.1.1]
MNRRDLNDMLWFQAVAEESSFTKAAAKLGTSQSTLSHTVKQLEARLGLRLLTRTTRSVSPTEAGERLLRALAPRIQDIENDIDALMAFRDKPSGNVRITLSDHALDWIVWPKLKPVLRHYPDIHVELNVDNGFRNIVEERFDAGVRLGESVDKDMVAIRISPDWRLVIVASPDYLARHPAPGTPQDLVQHDCINHRQSRSGGLYAWEFARDGRELRVRVDGQLTFNSTIPMIDAAVSGLGIAYVPENLVTDEIRSGRLVLMLDEWCPLFPGYYLYYPTRRQNSPAFAVIANALRHADGSS